MRIFTRAKSIWWRRSEKGKTSLCGFNLSHFSTIFMSSITYSIICLLFYWCLELIYIKITVTNNRYYCITVYCGNLPNISLMTQNLLGTEGWGNYMCLSALAPSGNAPTLRPFQCNSPTHPRGSRGGGNK